MMPIPKSDSATLHIEIFKMSPDSASGFIQQFFIE